MAKPWIPIIGLGFALLASPALSADRDALRKIVQEQCLVHWLKEHLAAPCERIYLADDRADGAGYAVLADRKGGAHFLLIPTQTIGGIESKELFEPNALNYFQGAWQARDRIAAVVGHDVPRSAVGLALNPKHARSQDQLHIHIECLRADVNDALRHASGTVGTSWSEVSIGAARFEALRIMGEDLGDSNPFWLLARKLQNSTAAIEDYSLIVAGMQFKEGPGFVVLAGTGLAGELLLDASCAVAQTAIIH
jgi:CDP-diacylglycerol pyrophosphatase